MRDEFIRQALSQRFDDTSDAAKVGSTVASALRLLHEQLSALVGTQAAGALMAHAVHRTRSQVAWTLPAAATCDESMFAALRADLVARPAPECLQAGETLIFALIDHLISLIGEPLTLRMLNTAWSTRSDAGPSSQENL